MRLEKKSLHTVLGWSEIYRDGWWEVRKPKNWILEGFFQFSTHNKNTVHISSIIAVAQTHQDIIAVTGNRKLSTWIPAEGKWFRFLFYPSKSKEEKKQQQQQHETAN